MFNEGPEVSRWLARESVSLANDQEQRHPYRRQVMDKDSAMFPDRLVAVVELTGIFHAIEVFFP